MNKIILFIIILISNLKLSQAQLVDIDGNIYKTVKIGNQTWMAENLKVSRFRNGDLIPLAKSYKEFIRFGEEKKPARFIETDSSKNIFVTYNWYAVNDNRGLAPGDWHVPHYVEWKILITTTGGEANLKSASGWLKNENREDQFGFNAKPSRALFDCGWWWTATEIKNDKIYDYAHFITISWCESQCSEDAINDCYIPNPFKVEGHSVRCIKNEEFKKFEIGDKIFMANNLNLTKFRNGDSIFFAKNKEEWALAGREKTPAYCYLNFDSSENTNRDLLYNYFAVKDERGLAPFGWRIPSLEDIYKIRDEKKENKLVHLLNKNNKSKKDIWGWWTSDYAMEDEFGRGILGMGGYIIHSSDNIIHTNERYLPEDAFNIICIKE